MASPDPPCRAGTLTLQKSTVMSPGRCSSARPPGSVRRSRGPASAASCRALHTRRPEPQELFCCLKRHAGFVLEVMALTVRS